MKNLPSVLVIGGTTFDHIVYLNNLPDSKPCTIHQCRFQETTGSTGTGKALALHQLGVPVHLISACGDDIWGSQIRNYLHKTGVSFDLFTDQKGTERHINLMDADGKRISIFITNSSETIDLPDNYLKSQIDTHDIIVLNIISYCRPWASLVSACNKPVWTDLHDYNGNNSYHQPFIDAAQYIHLSSDNLSDYRSLMQRLIHDGKKLVVCTHAKAGASLLSAEEGWMDVSAPEVHVKDTNGAGDNFFAGFLYGWIRNETLHNCMNFGARAAALCVQSNAIVSEQLNVDFLLKNL
jgi:sugar/nucleoside kinase (ribokinase family)